MLLRFKIGKKNYSAIFENTFIIMARKLKTFIIVVVLFCINFNAIANDNDKVLWGLKATVDAELPGKWHGNHHSIKMYNNGIGFSIGGVSNIYLGKNFYFEPGVSFFYSQYSYDLIIGNVDGLDIKDPQLYKLGIELPLIFGYTIYFSDKFAMNVFTGPQFRYALGGKVVINDNRLQEELKPIIGLWETQRRFDCSWRIGVGFPINHLTVSLEADLGISDLLKEDMSFRENRLGLGLTYFF